MRKDTHNLQIESTFSDFIHCSVIYNGIYSDQGQQILDDIVIITVYINSYIIMYICHL